MNTIAKRLFLVLTLVALFAGSQVSSPRASANVDGDIYTSPTHGYSLTLPNELFVVEEWSEVGIDYLILSDGFSFIQIGGGPAYGSPSVELAATLATCGSDGVTQNCRAVFDEYGNPLRGSDETRAWSQITFEMEFGGFWGTFYNLIEVRTIRPGISLVLSAQIPEDSYLSFLPTWESLLAGIEPDSPPSPPAPIPDPDDDSSDRQTGSGTETGSELDSNAPTISTHDWRFFTTSTYSADAIPTLGLDPKGDRDWLVVFAEVTNWSDADLAFSLRDPLVQTAEMTDPWDIAPASTRSVARLLDFDHQSNSDIVVHSGETEQIVLVYSIPSDGSDLRLSIGSQTIQLTPTTGTELDSGILTPPVSSPQFLSGTILGVAMDDGGLVTVATDTGEVDVTLLGATIPGGGDCYTLEALTTLAGMLMSQVLLESDPGAGVNDGYYLWLVEPDGSKVLMNDLLLEQGSATLEPLPEAARFGTWLADTERTARESGAGLWSTCAA